jgi:DNA invertase Pin-like site-specific DNA recombinase
MRQTATGRELCSYLRVSTLDQTTANQERKLRDLAGRMGCNIVHIYKDHGIGGGHRPPI